MTPTRLKSSPLPAHPDILRRPVAGFGWLEQSLVSEGWLCRLGANGTAVLVLLALAADKRGASFFSRDRMASALGMTRHDIDDGLDRLLDLGLVAFRPWRPAHPDGVWQLLPVPKKSTGPPRNCAPLGVAQIIAALGLAPPAAPPENDAG